MLVGRATDQLRVNTNSPALSDYRPFDDSVHPERLGDLRHRELCGLEAHYRGARNDTQIVNACEPSDKSLGHSVGQIFLHGVAGEVLEGQYRQRPDGRLPRTLMLTAAVQRPSDNDKRQSDGSGNEHSGADGAAAA